MSSESAKATNKLYPRVKVSGEESTDEGSASSDNESAVAPTIAKTDLPKTVPPKILPAKSNQESFSRSALRARGEAALARIQAQSQTEEAMASPPLTDRTQWSRTECKEQWMPGYTVGEQTWTQNSWDVIRMMGLDPLVHQCEQCPWEMSQMTMGAEPWVTDDPWGNSMLESTVTAEAEHYAALSQPPDAGIAQSCENDPIFHALEKSSSGQPVKVSLPETSVGSALSPGKQLDVDVPVKKRPPFPECVGSYKALDPSLPAKKRMPKFLLDSVLAY